MLHVPPYCLCLASKTQLHRAQSVAVPGPKASISSRTQSRRQVSESFHTTSLLRASCNRGLESKDKRKEGVTTGISRTDETHLIAPGLILHARSPRLSVATSKTTPVLPAPRHLPSPSCRGGTRESERCSAPQGGRRRQRPRRSGLARAPATLQTYRTKQQWQPGRAAPGASAGCSRAIPDRAGSDFACRCSLGVLSRCNNSPPWSTGPVTRRVQGRRRRADWLHAGGGQEQRLRQRRPRRKWPDDASRVGDGRDVDAILCVGSRCSFRVPAPDMCGVLDVRVAAGEITPGMSDTYMSGAVMSYNMRPEDIEEDKDARQWSSDKEGTWSYRPRPLTLSTTQVMTQASAHPGTTKGHVIKIAFLVAATARSR